MTYSYQYARRHGYIAHKWDRNPFKSRYIKNKDGTFSREGFNEFWEEWDFLPLHWRPRRYDPIILEPVVHTITYSSPDIHITRRGIIRTTEPGTIVPRWQR